VVAVVVVLLFLLFLLMLLLLMLCVSFLLCVLLTVVSIKQLTLKLVLGTLQLYHELGSGRGPHIGHLRRITSWCDCRA
jgi:hypothetical protein